VRGGGGGKPVWTCLGTEKSLAPAMIRSPDGPGRSLVTTPPTLPGSSFRSSNQNKTLQKQRMTGINKRKHKPGSCNKTEKRTWKEIAGTRQTSKRTACVRDGTKKGVCYDTVASYKRKHPVRLCICGL
jgi:hypothetical protein